MFRVDPLKQREIDLSVPASKSILSRALLLAAFTEGDTLLAGTRSFGRDTEDLLSCLNALGILIERGKETLLVHGSRRFSRCAALDVGSAGTAARFLPAILAFFGGEYEFTASEQMSRRPMAELLGVLRGAGAEISDLHFPFRMKSAGIAAEALSTDTSESTQFASGLLLAAALTHPLKLTLTGPRSGGYLDSTLSLIECFGGKASRAGREISVSPLSSPPARYDVPPDVSAACYFYALSLLSGARVRVRGVNGRCLQSGLAFLEELEKRGVRLLREETGFVADGRAVSSYAGFWLDLSDYADELFTYGALAPFAATPSRLTGIAHVRKQESDRVKTLLSGLSALGVPCGEEKGGVAISPAPPRSLRSNVTVKTFGDHRAAMAFSLVGLKTGNVTIDDPACCEKTFPDFFEIIEELTK